MKPIITIIFLLFVVLTFGQKAKQDTLKKSAVDTTITEKTLVFTVKDIQDLNKLLLELKGKDGLPILQWVDERVSLRLKERDDAKVKKQ